MNESDKVLVDLLRDGNQHAAEEIFNRYVRRLIALSRQRLSAKIRQRVDAEDILQSVFRSFFQRAQDGQFEIEDGGDLWRLLVVITLNKLRRKVDHHTATKRGVDREAGSQNQTDDSMPHYETVSRGPSPAAELELSDELGVVTADFSDAQRRMVELRLQGYQLQDIADDAGTSERTVRRTMDRLKVRLTSRAADFESTEYGN